MTIVRTEPYALGYMSYCSNIPKINNPYPTDSSEHEEWNQGWDEAKRESEENERLS